MIYHRARSPKLLMELIELIDDYPGGYSGDECDPANG